MYILRFVKSLLYLFSRASFIHTEIRELFRSQAVPAISHEGSRRRGYTVKICSACSSLFEHKYFEEVTYRVEKKDVPYIHTIMASIPYTDRKPKQWQAGYPTKNWHAKYIRSVDGETVSRSYSSFLSMTLSWLEPGLRRNRWAMKC